jgi:hypothetical protein
MAIYHKLSVTSRNDAVERAGALGLLSDDAWRTTPLMPSGR